MVKSPCVQTYVLKWNYKQLNKGRVNSKHPSILLHYIRTIGKMYTLRSKFLEQIQTIACKAHQKIA